jgi:hypothetical protein
VEDIPIPDHKRKFYIGDDTGLCLEASVFMPGVNPMYEPHICILHKIDALEECAIKDSGEKNASLGTEVLYAFISILRSNYPHVNKIKLTDTSYIPCNRRNGDTLDLLTYNIALYGQTWYEMKAGAYLPSATKRATYEKDIGVYMKLTTNNYSFDTLYRAINRHNQYAAHKIYQNIETYRAMYTDSKTVPEFLGKLKNTIDPSDKCKFFKGWLEAWLNDFVHIERNWTINIDENPILGKGDGNVLYFKEKTYEKEP